MLLTASFQDPDHVFQYLGIQVPDGQGQSIRQLRGTRILFKTDGDNVKKYFLPNA